jgi:hypothetical protein
VCSDEHLAQLDEIAVFLVVNLNDTPRVTTSANLAPIGAGDLRIGTNHSEWNLGHNLVILRNCLIIIEFVTGSFKDLDVVVLNICEYLKKSVQEN